MPQGDANSLALRCYRCGGSLESLSLPLGRLDLCPACGVELHVCRMCVHYAPTLPDACDEDDALEVRDKTSANFCDYFSPAASAFDGREKQAEDVARLQLEALFGETDSTDAADPQDAGPPEIDPQREAAEKLFRK